MIPNAWYPILESDQLRGRSPVGIRRLGRNLVLWRAPSGEAVAFPDRCSHRAAKLSPGRVRDGCLECPYHGLRFDASGACVRIPANGDHAPVPQGFDMESLPIREAHGLIWYWNGAAHLATDTLPWYSMPLLEKGRTATIVRTLDINYLRVMENGADVHHFPFVHRSINPGAGARVDDFEASTEEDRVHLSGTLRKDGRPESRPFPFRICLQAPCFVAFDIYPRLDFMICATPIDEDHTWLWARYGHDYPVGGKLGAKLFAWLDFRVTFMSQDLRVLRGQQLPEPSDISGYHLYEADRAVALFFSLRRRLIRKARETAAAA